ncbi:amino acid adenylation domain-containing protein [Streptacidiphilus sp. ASG 303]|uniref:non-ribosomal peptide synthetase n=1 Tax=Streptacidiphilus sp. ASG 303 TaxID=2896847 RepID=UPI001E525988|nr:non-ribosomal peptide synthetase [Streptacidiphilus sp. ASG 303]MCD0485531.1 amino acid adenylation domain-containing protein [Streptacidiphilus sp. ASG 303]
MQPHPSWNATSAPYPDGETLHGIFGALAAARPAAPCLVHRGEPLGYGLVDRASDAYAVQLAALGIGRGDLVPIRLPRGPELVTAVLAVLKLGAAYALVDGGWPRSRVEEVVAQLEAKVLVGGGDEAASGLSVPVWSPPPGGPAAVAEAGTAGFTPVAVSGDDPACVFFTSGTTGRPKGVLTPHRATVRLFRPGSFARFAADTVLPQAAPVPWDGYSLELWSVLLNGGTSLVVEEPYLSAEVLRSGVERHGVDTVWLTSSLFAMLVDEDPGCLRGLRQVMIGGERVSVPHVRAFLAAYPDTLLLNCYGPVESTVFTTTHRITAADCERPTGIPIGRPVPDTQVHVLDGDRPCGVGETGELCIGGHGLALRYLGRPELTAEKFTEVSVDGVPTRLYRTGDLAFWDEEGLLHYRGRADRQVKVRGHRIEPAEVERQIEELLPGVGRCAVVAVRDASGTCRSLAAFCRTVRPGDGLDGGLAELRSRLVHYHLPSHLVPVAEFPLTANGKLDEAALLALLPGPADAPGDGTAGDGAGDTGSTGSTADTAGAAGPDALEALVAGTWAAVLGRPGVPLDAGFAELGGGSLDAGRVCARLAAGLERPVPVSALLQRPTVRGLAAWLRHTAEGAPATAPAAAGGDGPLRTPDPTPLTPAQTGFLTAHLLDPEDRSGHCLAAWLVEGPLDRAALDSALEDVHHRHAALSAAYRLGRGGPHSVPGAGAAPRVTVLPSAATAEDALAAVRTGLAAPLDLAEGEVWRAVLGPVADGTHVFGHVVHHIAFDGWSEAVLAADIATAYTARLAGGEPEWDPLPSPGEVHALREAHRGLADRPAQLARLSALLRGVPDLALPPVPRAAAGAAPVLRTEVELDGGVGARIDRLAASAGATRFAVVLASYARALAETTGRADFGVGVPVAQRIDSRLEGLVGCHIGTLCLRTTPELVGADPAAAAAEAARLARQAFAHQEVGVDELARAVNPPRSGRAPFFQTLLAYQDNRPADLDLPGCRSVHHRLPYLGIPAEILAEVWPVPDGGLRLVLNSRTRAVAPETARALAKTFADLLSTC